MNRLYPHPIIAREGWPFIGDGLILSVLFSMCCGWWSLPPWIFTMLALQFSRDPTHNIPQDTGAVLSPVGGHIVVVERARDPYRNMEALKISVFMNMFNVHSQKALADCMVTAVEYMRGKFMNADLDKASTENEHNAVLATTQSGREITPVQVAGLVAHRILYYTKAGEWLSRGGRYSFIRFGSCVDVYLPVDAQVMISIGDKVTGVSTVLARLPLHVPVATPEESAKAEAAAAVSQDEIEASAEKVRGAADKEIKG